MNKKQKIGLISGIILIVASPFLGVAIAPLLHPVTCQPDVPGRLQLFNCLGGDFWIWIVTLILALVTGVFTVMTSLHKEQSGRMNKQKTLFVIPWTRRSKTKVTKQKILRSVGVLVVILVITVIGLLTNVVPFGYAVIRCGQLPVESTKFMADFSYKLPGDKGYGVNVFSEYTFCTQEEIKATNGYHRNVNTDAAKAENEANRLAREDAAKFSGAKIDYQVYVPQLEGYSIEGLRLQAMSVNDIETFFNLRKTGTQIALSFREGKIPSSYQLCKLKKYKCEEVGHDKYGNVVQKQTAGSEKRPIIYYGVNRGDTFINIGQGRSGTYSNEDIINIINTLEPYRE